MGRSGMAAVSLFVALVVGMPAASAASASPPVWAYCAKASPKNTGAYSDKACASAAVGHNGPYELLNGIGKGKPFKGINGLNGGVDFHWQVPALVTINVSCQQSKISGRFLAPNMLAGVVISMAKCTAQPFMEQKTETCSVSTQPLSGELGWIDQGKGEVGVKLTSEAAPEGLFADFSGCFNEVKVRARGSLILGWGPVGVITGAPVLASGLIGEGYEDEGKSCQKEFFDPAAFEGEAGRHVLTGEILEFEKPLPPCEEASLQTSLKLKGEALMVH